MIVSVYCSVRVFTTQYFALMCPCNKPLEIFTQPGNLHFYTVYILYWVTYPELKITACHLTLPNPKPTK